MMKTTIEIDRALLKKVQRALKTTTIKETVDASLKSVLREQQLSALADALGTIPLDLTVEQLRGQRAKRALHVSR
jgi:Arc/MetJ family transcription regulator